MAISNLTMRPAESDMIKAINTIQRAVGPLYPEISKRQPMRPAEIELVNSVNILRDTFDLFIDELTMYGTSEQAGMPSPDYPQPITSIDSLSIRVIESDTTIPIDLQGYELRSLPDGTRDDLNLTYTGNGSTDGYGLYHAELTQRVGSVRFGDVSWTRYTNKTNPYFRTTLSLAKPKNSNDGQTNVLCTSYQRTSGTSLLNNSSVDQRFNLGTWELGTNSKYLSVVDKQYETAADFKSAMGDAELIYPFATEQTHDLGTIELPIIHDVANMDILANDGIVVDYDYEYAVGRRVVNE